MTSRSLPVTRWQSERGPSTSLATRYRIQARRQQPATSQFVAHPRPLRKHSRGEACPRPVVGCSPCYLVFARRWDARPATLSSPGAGVLALLGAYHTPFNRSIQTPSPFFFSDSIGSDESGCNGSDDGSRRDPVTVLIPKFATGVVCGSGVLGRRSRGACVCEMMPGVRCSKGCVTGR